MSHAIVAILVLAVLAIVFSVVFHGLWLRRTMGRPNPSEVRFGNARGGGVCGKCGYPARGLSGFECPECGADLRNVGIRLPGQSAGVGSMVAALFLYSICYLVVAGVVYGVIQENLPQYMQVDASIRLSPSSAQYTARLHIEGQETVGKHNAYSSSFGFTYQSNTSPTQLSVRLDGMNPKLLMETIELTVDPSSPPGGAWSSPRIAVEPGSAKATWTDVNGKAHKSQGAVTDQDVLAFLGGAGVDTARQDTMDEALELHTMLLGLSQAKNQFTLLGFRSSSSGSGMTGGTGPEWFDSVYNLSAIALWIVGMVWIVRRARRKVRS